MQRISSLIAVGQQRRRVTRVRVGRHEVGVVRVQNVIFRRRRGQRVGPVSTAAADARGSDQLQQVGLGRRPRRDARAVERDPGRGRRRRRAQRPVDGRGGRGQRGRGGASGLRLEPFLLMATAGALLALSRRDRLGGYHWLSATTALGLDGHEN